MTQRGSPTASRGHARVRPVRSELSLTVNGELCRVSRDPPRKLLELLRVELELLGTKYGCGEGECGACTVLVDGEPVHACQRDVSTLSGTSVVTIEGLAHGARLHPVQQAFAEVGAFQCGFCTPGMIVRTAALLERNPRPSREQMREALDGNICRCGGYARILRAVERSVQLSSHEGRGPK